MNKLNYKKLPLIAMTLGFMAALPAQAGLMIYPMKGQSSQQQSKDRYECHVWSVQQSGFDPSTVQANQAVPQTQQQGGQVLRGGARGAAAGAAIGAIAGDAGKGAAIGATAGGIRGGFRRMEQNRTAQTQAQNQASQQAAGQDAYYRAMKACLIGRNYSVN